MQVIVILHEMPNVVPSTGHSNTVELVVAIIASSALTKLLDTIFTRSKQKAELKKSKSDATTSELELDVRLQKYYKDQYSEVMSELQLLRQEFTALKVELQKKDRILRSVQQELKAKANLCQRENCDNKLIIKTKRTKNEKI